MTRERLTSSDYWESGYAGQSEPAPLTLSGFRRLPERRIVERIEALGLEGQRTLEIGAGNSAVLCYLSRTHGVGGEFSGLDYSESGCRLLRERARREGARVEVYHQDLFAPDSGLLGRFDRVYSLGVVEHFADLPGVLTAKARFLAPAGRMLTVIPNMAGLLGSLTRRYNRKVYELHVPHTLASLRRGHEAAGLTVEASGNICSSNFGVLSSCFTGPADPGWRSYLWLSRLSSLAFALESRMGDLPHTAWLSPYLYVVSHLRV